MISILYHIHTMNWSELMNNKKDGLTEWQVYRILIILNCIQRGMEE